MTISDIAAQWCDGWYERVEFYAAVRKVNLRKKGEGAGSLHSDHPSGVRKVVEHRKQPPVITQLLEARWSRPVRSKDCERGSRALHAPLPGNLEEPDAIMSEMVRWAGSYCVAFNLATRWAVSPQLERRCAGVLASLANAEDQLPESARANAFEAVSGPHRAAMDYLGYDWHPAQPMVDSRGIVM